MKNITGRQLITILATLITLAVNILANTLPLNGLETGTISDRFEIFFVPAGYVFSIWGLIYLGLALYTIYQASPKRKDDKVLNEIAPLYWISSLANSTWIFLWHYEVFSLTLAAMLTILVSLVLVSSKLLDTKGTAKWLVRLPFSIYLGWISVATIANFSQTLYFFDWAGWGIKPELWAVVMLGVASLLGILKIWRESDAPNALVLIWAFVGITVSQAGTTLVVNAAWASAAVLALLVIGNLIRNKKIY